MSQPNKTRRGKLQVIKAGLCGIYRNGNKTSFLHGAETSYPIYRRYFKIVLENNLIEPKGEKYCITPKGWEFIVAVERAEKFIGEA